MNCSEIIYDPEKLQELIIVQNKDGLYNITYKKVPEKIIKNRGKFGYEEIVEDAFTITECDIKSIKIKIEVKEKDYES